MRLRAELKEVADDGEGGRTRRPVFITSAAQEKPGYDKGDCDRQEQDVRLHYLRI